MKYSIIVVTYNAIEHTTRCIDAILRNSPDAELIVVDNASTDGTVGYLKGLFSGEPVVGRDLRGTIKRGETEMPFKLILNTFNKNFGPGNNDGYQVAEGEIIVLLNSDTVVTIGWLKKMTECLDHKKGIAIVGPVSNSSNGRQMVAPAHTGFHDLEYNAAAYGAVKYGQYEEAGVLYGWCMMISREFLKHEPYLFDDRFTNSYEDNDLCLRARTKGWKLFIDRGTYIFHAGQGSFKHDFGKEFLKKYQKNGIENEVKFFDKWKPKEEQKLIAVYRIANCDKYIRESMERTSEFADEIICLFARSQDKTKEIALSFPKVTMWEEWNEAEHPFDEQAERNWLLQAAISRGADWVISIDGDEVYEKKFVKMVPKLLRNPNPQALGYWCNWRTIWDTIDGVDQYRTDGIFGGFQNYRFFKVLPGMKIEKNDNLYNHHCGSAPFIPGENLQWLNVRVKHLGYDTEEQRKKKHAFYKAADPHPLAKDVGNSDYHHLVDRDVKLKPYKEKNDVSVMAIVKDEEDFIYYMMKNLEPIADEYVIVDTGSTDGTLAEIERFAKYSVKPVRVIQKTFTVDEHGMLMNYSEAKNYAKSQCTGEWILAMDADELFKPQEVTFIFGFLDEEIDGLIFQVCNYVEPPTSERPEDNKFSISEAVRLYKNKKEMFYSGLIHESLEDCAKARARVNKGFMLMAPIMIHHRGYLRAVSRVQEKFDRYAKINMKQFAISGKKDPRPLFNLALHLQNEGKDKEAMVMYRQCVKLSPNFWRANQNMAYFYLDKAKDLLGTVLEQMPETYKQNYKGKEIFDNLGKYHFKLHKMGA